MLAKVLQAVVDASIARFTEERDENGRRPVVRNSHHRRREVKHARPVLASTLARCERAPPRSCRAAAIASAAH
jgi:hypothetical protein